MRAVRSLRLRPKMRRTGPRVESGRKGTRDALHRRSVLSAKAHAWVGPSLCMRRLLRAARGASILRRSNPQLENALRAVASALASAGYGVEEGRQNRRLAENLHYPLRASKSAFPLLEAYRSVGHTAKVASIPRPAGLPSHSPTDGYSPRICRCRSQALARSSKASRFAWSSCTSAGGAECEVYAPVLQCDWL